MNLQTSAFIAALIACGIPAYADPFVAPAPEDLSMYHVMLDRFANGSTANDDGNPYASFAPSSPGGYHGGDLEGVRQKLPYIRGMGFNALWLSPFLANTGAYHGYGTFNWYAVDPNFGTLAELQALVTEANSLGIAVYYDMVVNHCGNQVDSTDSGFPAYLPPPSTYTLRWRTGLQYPAPFNSLTHFHAHGQIGTFDVIPEQEIGELSSLDDLKTETTYVRDEMYNIWAYWMENTGVSGFRVDTVKHVDIGFWDNFLPRLNTRAGQLGKQNFYVFGEVYGANDSAMANYIGNLTSGTYRFDAALDFQYYYTSNDVFAEANSPTEWIWNRMVSRNSVLGSHHLKEPNFMDNHDLRRFLNYALTNNPGSGLSERLRRLDLSLAFMFTAPGPPILYYGTEQSFDGGTDPNNREDMFDGQFESGPSLGDNFDTTSTRYRLVKRLNELRTAFSPLRRGTMTSHQTTSSGAGILAYSRRNAGEEVLVVMNTAMSSRTQNALSTTWTAGQVVVDALNTADTQVIGAGGSFPLRSIASQGCHIWVRQEDLPVSSPEVTTTTPANLQSNVDPTADLVVKFSVAMDHTTTEAAISLTPPTAYTITWELADTQIRINPTSNLAARTSHTLSVAATAESASGAPLLFPTTATFTTGRDFSTLPPIPPPYATLGQTPLTLTADGNGSEWGTAVLGPDSWTLSSNQVFFWKDTANDDAGPGTYTYPTNVAFTTGDADIDELRVALSATHLHFYLKPVSINPTASFFTPYFGFGIDLAPGGRTSSLGYDISTTSLGIVELEVRPDAAPEFELVFTGPTGARLINAAGTVVSGTIPSGFSQSTGQVEIAVPRSMLGLTGTLTAQSINIVAYTALETFGGVREVGTTAAAFTPGGGTAQSTDPDVFDLVGATTANQTSELADFDSAIPAVIVRSVIPLVLSDTATTVETWTLY